MNKKVNKALEIWHKHFEDENKHYIEFEKSDIEYFVSCMIYNHFNFKNALSTMKSIDLSYDFLCACGNEYDEIKSIIDSIKLDSELEEIEFLQNFIKDSQAKYTQDERYLLDRMAYHVDGVLNRFKEDIKEQKVEFIDPASKSMNPLLK